ncbi:MAG: aspartate aminotransferase family protein [Pseudomonadota bacterium]
MDLSNSAILATYKARTVGSGRLYQRAQGAIPSGITHDSRYLLPHPLYVTRADRSRKWDVDGNEYVDYSGGHGALILGHNHPVITEAVRDQLACGTHFGACHELEVRWAELVKKLLASAERVRFTSSGTEATLLALRLARAYTSKSKLIRFVGHFHGWHDHMAFAYNSHYDGTPSTGLLAEVADNVLLLPPNDVEAMRRVFASRDDIAAAIIEPTGATWGQVPVSRAFVEELRRLTSQHGVVLIFDEVVSGFRCSPGGAQDALQVTPELTTLAKILAGGLPGGAVAGRKDIMDEMDFLESGRKKRERINHQGTFNANPLSAAAGIAALEIIAATDACDRANAYAARLRAALNAVIADAGVPWVVYGSFSGFHIFTNPRNDNVTVADLDAGRYDTPSLKNNNDPRLITKLRLGLLVHGVDIAPWPGATTSAVNDERDLDQTCEALRGTLRMMKEEGEVRT